MTMASSLPHSTATPSSAQENGQVATPSPPPTTGPQFTPPTLELSLADLNDFNSSLGLPLSPTSPIMPGMRASSASPPPMLAGVPGAGDASWSGVQHRPYATLPARSTSAPPTPMPANSTTDDLAPHLFWVPAHQHPEIAPLAFKDWLSRHDMQLTDSAVQRVRRRKSYRESVSVLSLKRNQSTGQSQVVISPVGDTDEEHEVLPIPEEPSEDGQQPPKPIHRTTLKRNLRTRPLRRPNSPALGAPTNDDGSGPSPPRNRNRDSTGSGIQRRRSHPRTSYDGVTPQLDGIPKSPTSPTSPVTTESLALPLPPVIPPVLGLVTPSLEPPSSQTAEDHDMPNDLAFEDSVLANYVVPPERSSSLRSRARVRPSVDTAKKDMRTQDPSSPMSPVSPTSPPPTSDSVQPTPPVTVEAEPPAAPSPESATLTKPSPVKSPPIVPPTLPPLSFDGALTSPILKSPPTQPPSTAEAQPQQQPLSSQPQTLHTTTVLAPLQIPPRVASVTSASTLISDEKPHVPAAPSHGTSTPQPLTIPSLTSAPPAKDHAADPLQAARVTAPTSTHVDLLPSKPEAFPSVMDKPIATEPLPVPPPSDEPVGRPRAGSNASLSSIDGVDTASTMSGAPSSISDKSPPLAKKKKGLFNFGKKKKGDEDKVLAVDHAASAATAASGTTTNGMLRGDGAGPGAMDPGVAPTPKMKKSSSWGWLFSSSSSSSSHKKVTPADAMTAVAALDAEDSAAAGAPAGTKKKEKSLVASLFKSGSSSSSSSSKKGGATGPASAVGAHSGRGAGGLVGTPGGQKYSNYAQRYPIHIERAICRLAHAKLANPRRPLHHQVLISNMLVWYMSLRKAEEEAAAQAALNGTAAGNGNGNGNGASAAGDGGSSSGDEAPKAIVWKGGRFQSNLGGKGKRRRKGSPRRAGQGNRSAEMVVASPSYSSGAAGSSPRWPEHDGYTSDGRGGVGAPGGRKGGRSGGRRRKRRGRSEGNSSSESDSSDEEDEDEDDFDEVDEDEGASEAPATPKLNGVSGPPLPVSSSVPPAATAVPAATADDEDDDVPLGLVMQKKPDPVKT